MAIGSNARRYATLLLATVCTGASCTPREETPTQVIVRFSAGDSLRPLASEISVQIINAKGEQVEERTDPVSEGADLARVPVVPEGDDATRSFEIVGQLLDEDGGSLGFERAVVGFEEGALKEVLLVFDEACRDVSDCGEGRRCSLGECVGACVDFIEPESDKESENRCGPCARCLATRCEALEDGTPCGCEGDVCDTGECSVAQHARHLSLGGAHTCAAAGDHLYCWGDNEQGQCGLTGTLLVTEPQVPLELSGFLRRVTTTESSTCVLEGSGIRRCFGANQLGQLGTEETNDGGAEVIEVIEPSLRDMVAGGHHFCGLTPSQEAWCWGYNTHGQLGLDGDTHHENAPARAEFFDQVSGLDAGGFQTCFLDTGELKCLGFNDSGQLGVGDTETRLQPVRPGCELPDDSECFDDFEQVSSGSFHTCGLREAGKLHCWGGNSNGQVGIGIVGTDELQPKSVEGPIPWTFLSAGFQQTCALNEEGAAHCWGAGSHGRLGNGDADTRSSPARVLSPEPDTRWVEIVTSKTGAHTCAIEGDGSLWCWGNNDSGQLGVNPSVLDASTSPRRVCFPP